MPRLALKEFIQFLLLGLLFVAVVATAQVSGQATDQATDAEQQQTGQQQISDQAAPVQPAPDDAGAQAQQDTGDDQNPQARFIPTEQISQDLGVSFPVDI